VIEVTGGLGSCQGAGSEKQCDIPPAWEGTLQLTPISRYDLVGKTAFADRSWLPPP
jgi:hypothetical protein